MEEQFQQNFNIRLAVFEGQRTKDFSVFSLLWLNVKIQLWWHSLVHMYLFNFVISGHATFGCGLNSLVHVVMYGYYFLAALGPAMRPYLWWKKYLTMFQLVQFVCIAIKSLVVVLGIVDCAYPWQMSLVWFALVAMFFYLFMEFYLQEYNVEAKKKAAALEKSQ